MRQRTSALATVYAVLVAAFLSVAVIPGSAQAAEANGCSGSATSFTSEGATLDVAKAPGAGGTQDQPFVINVDGKVKWEGGTTVVLKSGNYKVTVSGLPFTSGDFTNSDGTKTSKGTYNLSELPGPVRSMLNSLGEAKVPVTAEVTGPEGTCTASGYITGTGSPTSSPLFYTGLFFILIFLLLVFGMIFI